MIAFCDPGLANTAVIAYDERTRTIVAAKTFTTPSDGPTPDFAAAITRARLQAARVVTFALNNDCTVLVAEAYEDIPGPQRGAKHRWTTPLVCMAIADVAIPLERAPMSLALAWQSPKTVMTQYRSHKATWAAKRFGLVKGDTLLSNDHLRSAGCHLLAWTDERGAR
jgi:hypothetical protein